MTSRARSSSTSTPRTGRDREGGRALVKGLSSITKAMNDMAANHEDADHSASGFEGGE